MNQRSRATAIAAGVLVAAATACSGFLYPKDFRFALRPAVIQYHGGSNFILPDSARVGIPFVGSVTSWGGGCTRKGGLKIVQTGLTVTLEPRDSIVVAMPADAGCPDVERVMLHQFSLSFFQPGTATIRVHGLREPGRKSVTLTRQIVVGAE